MTIGDAYRYKLKFDDLQTEHIRLKELYGQQQAIIEAYQRHWSDRRTVQRVPWGFEREDTGV